MKEISILKTLCESISDDNCREIMKISSCDNCCNLSIAEAEIPCRIYLYNKVIQEIKEDKSVFFKDEKEALLYDVTKVIIKYPISIPTITKIIKLSGLCEQKEIDVVNYLLSKLTELE